MLYIRHKTRREEQQLTAGETAINEFLDRDAWGWKSSALPLLLELHSLCTTPLLPERLIPAGRVPLPLGPHPHPCMHIPLYQVEAVSPPPTAVRLQGMNPIA